MSQERKQEELRFISSEPVLAEILSKHKPLFISKAGWDWIVSWIAVIGSIMRSREYIASNIAFILSYLGLSAIFDIVSRMGISDKLSIIRKLAKGYGTI